MANDLGANINMEYAVEHLTGTSLKSNFEHIEKLIGSELPADFEEEFRTKTFEAFKKDLKPVKGIHMLLDQLSVPFCVASSGPVEKIKLNLTTANLINKFEDRIFSCYEIGSWKPEPQIFEHAAQVMGFKPKDCAVIEDSIAGVKAGIRGGFDVFALANSKNQAEFGKLGAMVFFDMEELKEQLSA